MFRRIESDHGTVTIYIDDKPFMATAGEAVANVLLNEGFSAVHAAPNGSLRGPYCMIGVCFDCMITLADGRIEQACQTYAEDGLRVYLPLSRGDKAVS